MLTDRAPLSDEEGEDAAAKPTRDVGGGGGEAPPLTMVVAGHVDAGKSTLVGSLLCRTGQVAQRTLHKFQKESAEMG